MERYVVTGIGAYNGLGSSAEQSWTNLLAGKSAVTRLSWPEDDLTRFPVSHSIIKTPIAALSNELTADDPHPEHFDYAEKAYKDPSVRTKIQDYTKALGKSIAEELREAVRKK